MSNEMFFFSLPRCDWTGMLSTSPVLWVSSGRNSYATLWGGYFIRKNYNLCVITYMYMYICIVHISKRKAKEKAGNPSMIRWTFWWGGSYSSAHLPRRPPLVNLTPHAPTTNLDSQNQNLLCLWGAPQQKKRFFLSFLTFSKEDEQQ